MQMLVCTQRHDGQFYAAPMRVIEAGAGDEPAIALRQVGPWGRDVERRHEVRVRVSLPVAEARVRGDGGWLDVDARVRDLSASGLGLSLDRPVAPGDRVTVALDLPDGKGVRVRARLVVRHATQVPLHGRWLAGGDFQTIAAEDQERLLRFVFACLRARARPAA
jgi:c-di-GMP-binding flagellar brake protein YcgR